MDYGLVEIGNIATKASSDAIRKLKSILDQHAIFYIVEDANFNQTPDQAASMTSINLGRARAADKPQDYFYSKNRRVIVPDLYALNFMSLLSLDSDEADFVSTLIYCEIRES